MCAKKILYFDVETTGLNALQNDIIQLSGIVEIGGEVKDEFNFKMQPFSYENISAEALEANGLSVEKIKTFPTPQDTHKSFCKVLEKWCNKFDRSDKFYPAGYNVKFDIDFLAKFFLKNEDNYLGSWINWHALDALPFLYAMDFKGEIALPNCKLSTICEHFKIELTAHDALSDVRAARELIKRFVIKDDVIC